jgi:ATP-dependent helicase HrpB
MEPLPIDEKMPEILAAVREAGALVLVAPPGAGKTTRVPAALLQAGLRAPARSPGDPEGSNQVVVLEPRRLAARAAAARVARERGWTLGREVGYRVRFESKISKLTRLQFVTEGVFVRRLQDDPSLEGVATVVLDEFHERSIHADLALAFLREVRESIRPDLAILVMSATLDPRPVAEFLGGCPVVEAAGRRYPVKIRHRSPPRDAPLEEIVAQTVRETWSDCQGHALVFLPGMGEIRRAFRALENFAAAVGALLLPLHGRLTLDDQQRAIAPSTARKILLSTNVAETSVTIDGVDLVIDSGYERLLKNHPRHGIDRLETVRISRHSAVQRAGRAGRLGPGKAIRLWSAAAHRTLPGAQSPEIRRVDLAATVLELRLWGVREPAGFGWFQAPPASALERAEALLAALGAVDGQCGPLTDLGKDLLSLPLHPRLGCMLRAACEAGYPEEGVLLAALLEERDILARSFSAAAGRTGAPPVASGDSDLLLRLEDFEEAERRGFRRRRLETMGLDPSAVRAVARLRDDLRRSARGLERRLRHRRQAARGTSGEREDALLESILAGYPDRIVRRRPEDPARGRMVGGRGVVLAPESVVREGDLFVAVGLDESGRSRRGEATVHLASRVSRSMIERAFPSLVREVSETAYDEKAERVRSTVALCYRDLPLEKPRQRRPPARAAQELLAKAARERAWEILESASAAAQWLRRVEFLRESMPELRLPAFDSHRVGELLATSCSGKTGLAELRKQDLLGLLKGSLSHELLAAIDRCAPEALPVPSGSRIRLRYATGKPPVLAVRLQELFGLAETPAVAGGKVPVLLDILGPNFRTVQITRDLRSFWNTTYKQVRKDLRGRYPKHAWPEDPWSATPERRPRRRRRS